MTDFSTVYTDRMVLRAATPEDADDLFPITSDPRTWTHAPHGRHPDLATTRDWLSRAAARWERDELSYWMARDRESGQVLGVGGVQRQRTGNWNLYYRFAPETWGHGYATELGRAALDAAHACDNSVAVVAWILSGHAASQHVAQRLGLVDRGPHVDPSDGVTRHAFTDRQVVLA